MRLTSTLTRNTSASEAPAPGRRSGTERLFRSFFLGGFECSTHRTTRGRRLDMVAATDHDRFARQDYARLAERGIRTAREGIRWHLIERAPGRYDFSSVTPILEVARETGTQVIWDLCHYGWPDDLDVFSTAFPRRLAALARAFVRLLRQETDDPPYVAPVNEMSFLAWAGGAMALFPPYARDRGEELKEQLVRAAIEATEAAWAADPRSRIFHIDPICSIVADPANEEDAANARGYCSAQFDAWDMLRGAFHPELGGDPRYLDVVGVNYYVDNQWEYPGSINSDTTIGPDHALYRPVWHLLRDGYERFRRPLFIAETGIEGDPRGLWLRYIGEEVRTAIRHGVPVEGICLYPILNHPGWEDDRHCHNGLWDYADEEGRREAYEPLARELERQQALFAALERGESIPEGHTAEIAAIWQQRADLGYDPNSQSEAEPCARC